MSELPINQVLNADCLEVTKGWPSDCVDLVIIDPPYNLGVKYASGHDDKLPWRVYGLWLMRRLRELRRVLRGGGQLYLHLATRAVGRVPLPTGFICVPWIKTFSQIYAMSQPFNWGAWEPIFYWSKGSPGYIGRTNDAAMDGDFFLGPNAMGLQRNGQVPERWNHPCPKPLWLAQRMIKRSCPPGGIVLDPCAGSGTSLVAAKITGRRYIGIELGQTYCELIQERLRVQEARAGQMALF